MAETKKELNETKAELFIIKNRFLNNKFNCSKIFIDDNGKQKSFIIPMNEKGGYDLMTFNDAVNYCAKLNSTLIELQSQRKQSIFESFMREIGIIDIYNRTKTLGFFWINGRRDSTGKFKWINSGNEFSFTNWRPGFPDSDNYVVVEVYNNDVFSKWSTGSIGGTYNVICELELNI